jgi:hypothetical protein
MYIDVTCFYAVSVTKLTLRSRTITPSVLKYMMFRTNNSVILSWYYSVVDLSNRTFMQLWGMYFQFFFLFFFWVVLCSWENNKWSFFFGDFLWISSTSGTYNMLDSFWAQFEPIFECLHFRCWCDKYTLLENILICNKRHPLNICQYMLYITSILLQLIGFQ